MGNLLFSPSGRVNPADFMRGVIILIVISALLTLIPLVVPSLGVLKFLGLILFWCWIVLYVKRFHDAGKSGWLTIAVIVAIVVLSMIMGSVFISMFAAEEHKIAQIAVDELSVSGGGFLEIFKGSMEANAPVERKVALPSVIGGSILSYAIAWAVNKFFPHDEGENQYGPA